MRWKRCFDITTDSAFCLYNVFMIDVLYLRHCLAGSSSCSTLARCSTVRRSLNFCSYHNGLKLIDSASTVHL